MNQPSSPGAQLSMEQLSSLHGLELKARLLVEGYLSGAHRSPYRGFSVEFAEHREYVPGDDLRYVDWKVYAKTDRYYLKQYDEETNYSSLLIVDRSQSMAYRSSQVNVRKIEYATWLAAALAYVIIQQRDAAGLVTYSSHIHDWLRPETSEPHWREICRLLEQLSPTGPSHLVQVIHALGERMTRRGVMIILSDFFEPWESLAQGLQYLHHLRHDVILLQVIDPAEEIFPFENMTRFDDLESGDQKTVHGRTLRPIYQKMYQQHVGRLRGLSRELGFDYWQFRTDAPPGPGLGLLLRHRRQKRLL
ncbi:MAG: hypothetical protein KatS3mg113_0920 [Planctomycetaceae bacterium]|nr:MAG: hypothetical protein KatS3mg113_0920 [Planctomycetaceae bacterium]